MAALSATLAKLGSLLKLDSSSRILLPAAPPQFDSSLLAATTGFVQQGLGNFRSMVNTGGGATYTMTAADMGKVLQVTNGNQSLVLPAVGSVPAGAAVKIVLSGAGTLSAAGGTNLIVGAGSGNSVASLALNGGDVVCVSDGSSNWWVSGSNTLAYLGGFFASLAANGYQKLPSGLIIQWLTASNSVPAGSQYFANLTFPIVFPHACLSSVAAMQAVSNINTNTFLSSGAASTSSCPVYINSQLAQTVYVNVFAIGY